MGYRRRHRSRSRDGSPERNSSRPAVPSTLQQYNVTSGEGDETSGHRTSSSRHHHRSHQRQHHHSERPRRRRERPEWLKMILRAQRQFVWAILMTVGLCLKRGAQLVSDMLLGAPVAEPLENRPQSRSTGDDRSSYSGGPSSSTAVATRRSADLQRSSSLDDDMPLPSRRAIVPPEELD